MRFTVRLLAWALGGSLLAIVLAQGCALSRYGSAEATATGVGASGAGTVGGGGAGAGGGITTSSTSSGGGGPEYCADGVDNDGDGDVDCADGDCFGFSCVPAVDGALAYLTPPEALPSCAAPTVPLAVESCEGCQCNPATISCIATVMEHEGNGCTGSGTTYTSPQDCVNVSDWDHSFSATTTPVIAENCDPAVATVDTTIREGCSVSEAGSCSTGDACVPSSLVSGPTCVLLSGHVDCPAAYPSQGEVYQDAPGPCTCSCEPYSTHCDEASIEYSNWHSGCQDLHSVDVGATCINPGWVTSFWVPAVAGTATCDPSGSPSGATAVTLCCTQ